MPSLKIYTICQMYFLDADNGNDGDGDDTDEEILNENEDSAQEQRSAYFNLI